MRVSVRRDERAVSPVIAEILLVAITVTVAGVVYTMANGFAMQAAVVDHPFVSLTSPSVQDGVVTVTVVAVSRAVGPTNYRVNLAVDGVLGHPVPLPVAGTDAMLPVGGLDYRVSWNDVGKAGVLVGGDTITIAVAGGALPAHTAFTFYLIWSDGSVLGSVSGST